MEARELREETQIGAGGLRSELSLRAMRFAATRGLVFETSDGHTPSIIFSREDQAHGNFLPASYRAICNNPGWARRLEKVHTASRRMRLRANWQWKELDCANSSDALLMNVFCHPGTLRSAALRAILGVDAGRQPEFGYKPRTPLTSGRFDNTEIDMRLGGFLLEAKLTESDFQTSRPALIERYRDFATVFDPEQLPMHADAVAGYQLIRGTLAAYAAESSFCVLCDARRPELAELWYRVLRAVRPAELRCRLKLLTWQELAAVLPKSLELFLAEKYGIVP